MIEEKSEPLIVLLLIDEFLSLKTIEERLANRHKNNPHPMHNFEHFRERI